jgi:NAD(P)-dependent dehydrogenase (short-subunit alcohol dehydrogenase family)
VYRDGGVYVLIGGAGGIGEVFTEHLVRRRARVIWVGRRTEDEAIRRKLDRLAAIGPAPEYIQADATDRAALAGACERIKSRYGAIHGVVHTAIVLLDKSLMLMDEERFRNALAAKVDVSVRLAQVFGSEPLDFMLFFSSLQSVAKAPGQSNYAAGCTFKDAYAHELRRTSRWAVKVMNWGYWGNVGIVASEAHRRRMAQAGVLSIEPDEGMRAVDVLLGGHFDQLAFASLGSPGGPSPADIRLAARATESPSVIGSIVLP